MDDVTEIRRRVARSASMRAVTASLGVSRNTVRRYVEGAPPETRRPAATPRARPKQEVVGVRLRELLAESAAWTTGKQRLTAEGYEVGLTLGRELVAEHRRQRQEVFAPLTYHPGDLCEVDFLELQVDLPVGRRKAWMLVVRLMYSGRDFAWLSPRQDQVCFLDGLARAFAHFGGVETRGRGTRLQELVPIPEGEDLASISAALPARLDARAHSERFAEERARFLESPAVAFDPAHRVDVRATRRPPCRIHGAHDSVPERWAALMVTASVGVDTVRIAGPDGEVARRRVAFGERNVGYRDDLAVLSSKPQAVRRVADALIADLGAPFDRAWRLLVDEHGPKSAARHFARLLGSVERHGFGGHEGAARRGTAGRRARSDGALDATPAGPRAACRARAAVAA